MEGYSGDSGTSKRQGGQVLKWLNDHKSDVYTIATCNNIDGLPPEFLRAERWDAIFFVDLPNEEERNAIMDLYKNYYGIEDEESSVNIKDWTGAEIKNLCKLAKNLEVSLEEASKYVCPIAKTAAEKIETLRNKVRSTTVPASKTSVVPEETAALSSKRKIMTV
jgi:SpoVK/Ycf46/Vps4 family AAA+-type ATPase